MSHHHKSTHVPKDLDMTASISLARAPTHSIQHLSSSSAVHEHDDRVVRFDNECVLIPEPKRPKVLRSYSLPLWKRKPPASTPDPEQDENSVVFKVPVPSFISKSNHHSRRRENQPLPSCLVRRPTSATGETKRKRSPSLSPSRPRNVTTVPLRTCCMDCMPIIEDCLTSGSEWEEKFSRGAQRRRAMSFDDSTSHEFGTVACNNKDAVVSSSSVGIMAINVDEVDNRRRRRSLEEDEAKKVWQNNSGHFDRERSSSRGSISSLHSRYASDPGPAKPDLPRVLPIEEEDEDQLFPLPSPRRSPSASPTPSPNTSASCLYGLSMSNSPRTSIDSLQHPHGSASGSEDSHCSLPRGRCDKGLLTPDTSPSLSVYTPSAISRLSTSPNHSSPSLIQSSSTHIPRTTSPVFSPSLHTRMSPVSFPKKALPSHPLASSFTNESSSQPLSGPTSSGSVEMKEGVSSSPKRGRGPSFSMPKPSSILKAGAEVLKGVGSVNGAPGQTLFI